MKGWCFGAERGKGSLRRPSPKQRHCVPRSPGDWPRGKARTLPHQPRVFPSQLLLFLSTGAALRPSESFQRPEMGAGRHLQGWLIPSLRARAEEPRAAVVTGTILCHRSSPCPQHPHLVPITLTLSPSPSPGTKYQRGAAQRPGAVTLPSSLCGHRAALTSARAPGQAVTRSVTGAGAILIITHCGFSAK